MPRFLIVEFLSGPRVGQRVQFNLQENSKIVFGADPTAQVSFAAEADSQVSRRHGTVVLDAQADTAHWLDSSRTGSWGRHGRITREALDRPTEISLGEHGPRLRLEVSASPAAGSRSPFASESKDSASTSTVVARPGSRSLAIKIGVGVAGVAALLGFWLAAPKTPDAEASAKMERLLKATKEELRNEATATSQKLDEEMREARRKMQSTLLDVDSNIATAKDKADAAAKMKGEAESFGEVARKCEHCVALVSMGDGSATAFAIGPQVFATNSHVSTPVAEALSKGTACWLVMNKGGGKRLHITRAEIHPRYDEDSRKPGIGYDVGLLFTDTKVDAWLPVASADVLAKLDAGTSICYIGFPSEGLSGGNFDQNDPVATMKRGILTAVSDWELRDGGPQRNLLLRHDMGSAGGASGSPIIDREGRVIGIHNAGNYFFLKDAPRIPNAANINFAQRIDCLKDIWKDYPQK